MARFRLSKQESFYDTWILVERPDNILKSYFLIPGQYYDIKIVCWNIS